MANKTILVPIDFSGCSLHALRFATAIAKTTGRKLVLVHSFYNSLGQTRIDSPDKNATQEQKVHGELMRMVNDLKVTNDLACDYMTGSDPLPQLLNNLSQVKKAGLVVMGTQGAGGISEFFGGTWASIVVQLVKLPVIVVPEKAVLSDISKMVFATDLHQSDIPAIRQMIQLAKVFEAHVEILHIAQGRQASDEENSKMENFMNLLESKIDFTDITYRILSGKNIEKALEDYLTEHKVSLMALSIRHRNWIERLFSQSVSQKMVMHAHTPLIVFHYEQSSVLFL